MKGNELLEARQKKNLEQIESANRLGISQPYLSLLESGKRSIPQKLARKAVSIFQLSPTAIPQSFNLQNKNINQEILAEDLAAIGYPNFAHLGRKRRRKNPADILLSAISCKHLDSRITEALPWLVFQYSNFDWEEVCKVAKINNLQNRLGFLTTIARQIAESKNNKNCILVLKNQEVEIEKSRLFAEDFFCNSNITEVEKNWLKNNRSKEAKFWRLFTDLRIENLNYAK